MMSSAEKFGAALARGIRSAAAVLNEDKKDPVMFRTNLNDVPKVEGLKRDDASSEDVVLVCGWMGAGLIEDSGYEVHPQSHGA